MIRTIGNILIVLFAALIIVSLFAPQLLAAPPSPGDRLSLSGSIKNLQGKGVKEVEVEVLLNGQHLKPLGKEETIVTGSQGNFLAVFLLPQNSFPGARLEVKAAKPCWQEIAPSPVIPVQVGTDQHGNRLLQAQAELTMKRLVTPAFWLAAAVLLLWTTSPPCCS